MAADATRPPKGTEDLFQGDDALTVKCGFASRDPSDPYPYEKDQGWTVDIEPSWNEVFGAIAPMMINESTDAEVRRAIQAFFIERVKSDLEDDKGLKRKSLIKFTFESQQIETVLVQFRALGLIQESLKARSVRDTKTYWRLTKHGDNLMTKLRALRRTPSDSAGATANPVPS